MFNVPDDWINETVNVAIKSGARQDGFLMMSGRLKAVTPGALIMEIMGKELLMPMDNVQHMDKASAVATGVTLAPPGGKLRMI